jgi:DNA-binding response OmpR family regulator
VMGEVRRARTPTIPPTPLVAVVEDERDMREWLADTLKVAGYQVAVAPNGLRLISVLQIDRPDLIVLDVNLSWIDGFELCRALKKNPSYADIPVVFLSGRTAPVDVAAGLACGAVDYIRKPIDTRTLLERVGELVQARRAR